MAAVSTAALISSLPALADTHYVSPSGIHLTPFTNWPTAATNIQAAIDAAVDGDLVLIDAGVYTAPGIIVRQTLTIRGEGQTNTVVQVAATPETVHDSVFEILAEGCRIEDMTIRHGDSPSDGGGVEAFLPSSNVLWRCTLEYNTAHRYGGGAYGCLLYECIIRSNSALDGGGARSCWLSECIVSNNVADWGGGGVAFSTLVDCIVASNTASGGGGATVSTLTRCLVSRNRATSGGGVDTCDTFNSLIVHNQATSKGGGAYNSFDLANCTIAWNEAETGGGTYGTFSENCIIVSNNADTGANYFGMIQNHCCTYPLPTNGIGNITNDPQFADLSNTNLRLRSTSPCIDAGTNEAWMAGAVDLDGLPRIINGTVDMGAYESPSPAITSITPPTSSDGPVLTWASFSNAQYKVYGSTNLAHGYDLLLRDNVRAYPPENAYTDSVSGVELRGYAVEYKR